MGRKYNLAKKSDMRRFVRDLEKDVRNTAQEAVKKEAYNRKYDISCPHCQESISVPPGKSICPNCKKEITLTLDIDFS